MRSERKIAVGDSAAGQPERECAAASLLTGKIARKERRPRLQGAEVQVVCSDQDARDSECRADGARKTKGGDSAPGQPERETADAPPPPGKRPRKRCDRPPLGRSISCPPVNQISSDHNAHDSVRITDHARQTKGSGSMSGQPERGTADKPPPPGKHPYKSCDRPPPERSISCPPVNLICSDHNAHDSVCITDHARQTKGSGSASGQPERGTADTPPPPGKHPCKSSDRQPPVWSTVSPTEEQTYSDQCARTTGSYATQIQRTKRRDDVTELPEEVTDDAPPPPRKRSSIVCDRCPPVDRICSNHTDSQRERTVSRKRDTRKRTVVADSMHMGTANDRMHENGSERNTHSHRNVHNTESRETQKRETESENTHTTPRLHTPLFHTILLLYTILLSTLSYTNLLPHSTPLSHPLPQSYHTPLLHPPPTLHHPYLLHPIHSTTTPYPLHNTRSPPTTPPTSQPHHLTITTPHNHNTSRSHHLTITPPHNSTTSQ